MYNYVSHGHSPLSSINSLSPRPMVRRSGSNA
jgi:hypothetical protein